MDITAAINYVQSVWMTVSGVRAAPNEPPDKLDPFPIAVTAEQSGEVDISQPFSSSFAVQKGTLRSELHISRSDLARSVRSAMSYRNEFLQALQADANLGGNIMIISPVRWVLGPMNWNGIDTIGYRFEIDVELELTP